MQAKGVQQPDVKALGGSALKQHLIQFYLLLVSVGMGSGHEGMSGVQSGLNVGWAVGLWWSPECFC